MSLVMLWSRAANAFANETSRNRGDAARNQRRRLRRASRSWERTGTAETEKTCVVLLITQRSRVQIPPRYQVSAGQGPDRRMAVRPFDYPLAESDLRVRYKVSESPRGFRRL
jgi:hypothetical protein